MPADSIVEVAKPPGLKIREGLEQLRPGVHHEGPMCRDGLTERLARENKHRRTFLPRYQLHLGPLSAEDPEVILGNVDPA